MLKNQNFTPQTWKQRRSVPFFYDYIVFLISFKEKKISPTITSINKTRVSRHMTLLFLKYYYDLSI